MKPEEINKAIAESVGWKGIYQRGVDACMVGWNGELPSGKDIHGKGSCPIPNYHGSLDAIVPVVRALPYLEWDDVMIELMHMSEEAGHEMALATPAQWCEAYLNAKGLWNE